MGSYLSFAMSFRLDHYFHRYR